jgi:hypothetical protein
MPVAPGEPEGMRGTVARVALTLVLVAAALVLTGCAAGANDVSTVGFVLGIAILHTIFAGPARVARKASRKGGQS